MIAIYVFPQVRRISLYFAVPFMKWKTMSIDKWSALRRFVQQRTKRSAMRLNPFQIFRTEAKALVDGEEGSGEVYRDEVFVHIEFGVAVRILRRCEHNVTQKDLSEAHLHKIDNTGHFHWPAEELLADFAMKTMNPADTVLELGAGTGLAGFCLSSHRKQSVILSDGNASVVELLKKNAAHSGNGNSVRLLRWDVPGTYLDLVDRVDVVIGADCLFFEDYHSALVQLVKNFFAAGRCRAFYIIAPSRGRSLEKWVQGLRSSVLCDIQVCDLDVFVKAHSEAAKTHEGYVSDCHYPVLVSVKKV